jgi:hypothetical protein
MAKASLSQWPRFLPLSPLTSPIPINTVHPLILGFLSTVFVLEGRLPLIVNHIAK